MPMWATHVEVDSTYYGNAEVNRVREWWVALRGVGGEAQYPEITRFFLAGLADDEVASKPRHAVYCGGVNGGA